MAAGSRAWWRGWVQGGFTRILHSGKRDDLMEEIPTFVAQQLPREQNGQGAYIVINRPYAFVQWTQQCPPPPPPPPQQTPRAVAYVRAACHSDKIGMRQ